MESMDHGSPKEMKSMDSLEESVDSPEEFMDSQEHCMDSPAGHLQLIKSLDGDYAEQRTNDFHILYFRITLPADRTPS